MANVHTLCLRQSSGGDSLAFMREVKASLVDAQAVLKLISLTGRHFNHKLLIHTGRQHGKHDSVSDGLTGGDVMILMNSVLKPED